MLIIRHLWDGPRVLRYLFDRATANLDSNANLSAVKA